ncbi:MAG: DUF4386 domain-containing protein [Dehalococcoidia bacterium]
MNRSLSSTLAPNTLARLASLAYIVVIVAGGWSELVVRQPLTVSGDRAATAGNIAGATGELRAAFGADMAMIIAFLVVGFSLWALLRRVSPEAALAMLVANAISVAVMSANLLNHGALIVLQDHAVELGSGTSGALAGFFLEMHSIGYLVAQAFFGLYLLPLGYLVYRSGMLPRWIGVLLMAGFAADMAQIGVEYLASDADALAEAVAAPAGIAELSLTLWLLVRGVRGDAGVVAQRAALSGANA